MGWLRDIVHKAANNPVTKLAEKIDPLAHGVTQTLTKAVDAGWGKPETGKNASGLDYIGAGPIYQEFHIGGNPDKPSDRRVGRMVGNIAALFGLSSAASAATDSTAESATSVTEGGGGGSELDMSELGSGEAGMASNASGAVTYDAGVSYPGSSLGLGDYLNYAAKGIGLVRALAGKPQGIPQDDVRSDGTELQGAGMFPYADAFTNLPGSGAAINGESSGAKPIAFIVGIFALIIFGVLLLRR